MQLRKVLGVAGGTAVFEAAPAAFEKLLRLKKSVNMTLSEAVDTEDVVLAAFVLIVVHKSYTPQVSPTTHNTIRQLQHF